MDYATLLRSAEHGQPPPLTLLHGHDGQLLDDALTAIGRGLFTDASQAVFDREVMDGREVTADAIVRSAATLPVLARRRLVVVRHCQALGAKGAETLAPYCANPNPDACLLLLADELLVATRDRKEHWLLATVPASAIVSLAPRQGRALEEWLRQRAAAEGVEVGDEAARLLVEWVGDDSAALLGEARKAALAGGPDNRTAGVKEVTAVVGERRLHGVFDLTRAVERRQVGAALRTLDALLVDEEPMRVVALLTSEVRTAWTIREWLRRGQTVEQIARTLRRPPGVIQGHAAAATATSGEAVAGKLRRCWDVERRLKSGGDARAELTALVAELCAG